MKALTLGLLGLVLFAIVTYFAYGRETFTDPTTVTIKISAPLNTSVAAALEKETASASGSSSGTEGGSSSSTTASDGSTKSEKTPASQSETSKATGAKDSKTTTEKVMPESDFSGYVPSRDTCKQHYSMGWTTGFAPVDGSTKL